MSLAAACSRRDLPGGRRAVLLSLADGSGTRGLGEASPLPGFSRESGAEAEAALTRARWDRVPAGLRADALPDALADWLAAAGLDAGAGAPPSATFAAETALLDLAGRRAGAPVHRLLRRGARARPVPLCFLISARDAGTIAEEARGAVAAGYRCLKWKIAHPGDLAREIPLLDALRAAAGPEASLRFDANGAWTPAAAREALAMLARYRPEYVEQPVAPRELEAMESGSVPIAADESLLAEGGAERIVARGGCRALVLKPMALGGFSRCMALAGRARAAGMAVAVTHLFDGPVGLAAAAELALALEPPPLACGLAPHRGLDAWRTVRVRQVMPGPGEPAAQARPLAAPGLGLEGDP